MKPTVQQLKNLIGNPEAFAEQNRDGSWYPIEQPISIGDLTAHLNLGGTFGTYVLNGDKARTLVFDLDEGDGDLEKAEGIRDELVRLGVPRRSVGVEFSGRKGYHVWMVVADYVPAKDLRRLGRIVLRLCDISCEVFPKQDEAKKLGNLVKLPGGIHQVSGKENNFIDRVPMPMSVQVWQRIADSLPAEPEPQRRHSGGGEEVDLLPCIAEVAEGVGEGKRNTALYHYAVLLRGSKRVPEEAVDYLVRQAAEACDPPYEGPELDALIESSKQGGPVCDQLGTPCEGRCVRNKQPKGGTPCEGQLLKARDGAVVPVTVTKDPSSRVVTISHPDIRAGGKVRI